MPLYTYLSTETYEAMVKMQNLGVWLESLLFSQVTEVIFEIVTENSTPYQKLGSVVHFFIILKIILGIQGILVQANHS